MGNGVVRTRRHGAQMILSSISIYPIKSTAGMDAQSAWIEARGFMHDRRWMVVDADNRFLTGRQVPRLVLVRAIPQGDGLQLEAPSMPSLAVLAPDNAGERLPVTVWDDVVDAACADADSDAWFSEFLDRPVRLVMMDAQSVRTVASEQATHADDIGFADGYPFLAISQASLDGLNARLAAPISMQRFRPNLVIDGCDPHAEDQWRRIRIGGIEFEAAKPCTRCVFTTVDPMLGVRDPSGEPLRTLKSYRRTGEGITFGMNWIARGRGRVRVGDPVEPY
ncbi:MAG TPA: MOSC N-terminal beta barrel domain-containing protein [Xanthomonadaceae bacterium]|nr:MOSC N-terminal beta barrel domain-containing protein [Xanthomonadaceae bacterium]